MNIRKIDPTVLEDLDGEEIHYDGLPEKAVLSRKYIYVALTSSDAGEIQNALVMGVSFLESPQGWDFWKQQFDDGKLSSAGRKILDATL